LYHAQSIDAVRLTDSRFDIRYCFRAQGSISVSLQLSRTGYAPGEPIVVHAGVENNSRRTLRYSQVGRSVRARTHILR
jgi:hypothetical protein